MALNGASSGQSGQSLSRRNLAKVLTAILMVCNCQRSALAGQMADFIHKTLQWTKDERPALGISRGLIMAWLPDPSTDLPHNPGSYYLNSAQQRMIVAPGVPLMIFPPRQPGSKDDGTRLSGQEYQLAVTQDGFWGVIDTAQSNSLIIESDLRKIVDAEASRHSQSVFGIIVQTTFQMPGPLPVTLSRGEVFRITSESSDPNVTIDFNSDVVGISSKQSDIADLAKKSATTVPTNFTIDPDQVKYIDIKISGSLVRDDLLKDWRSGQGHYEDIFNNAFSSLRWPNKFEIGQSCDTKVTIKSAADGSAEIKAEAGLSLPTKLASIIDAKFGLSVNGQASVKQSIDKTTTSQSVLTEKLSLIEYKERDRPETAFWVGTARTCAEPSWSTIVLKNASEERFLHSGFYDLPKDKAIPLNGDQIQLLLNQIKPGGNPWDPASATFVISCFAQNLQLEDFSANRMQNRTVPLYQIKAALIVSSFLKIQNSSRSIGRFIGSDIPCMKPGDL